MSFSLSPANLKEAEAILSRYPQDRRRAGLLPVLMLAQAQNGGWLSDEAIDAVAIFIGIPYAKAVEVVSFYTMFRRTPAGAHRIEICTNISCWLRGSSYLEHLCTHILGISIGQTTADGQITVSAVECLGACAAAPVMIVDDVYHENVTEGDLLKTLQKFSPKVSDSALEAAANPPVSLKKDE